MDILKDVRRRITYMAIFILGFIAISIWNFYLITHPPQIGVAGRPADFGLPDENITLTTSDGLRLSAWWVKSETAVDKAIILIHGYPVEKSDMLGFAQLLYPDFSLLMLDLRSFGESDGNKTTLGVHEIRDVVSSLDFLEANGVKRIGVFGFSLGGAVGLRTAAADRRVIAVASYGSFADLRTLGHDLYRTLWFLKYPMVELMLLQARITFGTSPYRETPYAAAKNLTVPALIIHSKNDKQIPFHHAELLQQAFKENPRAQFYFPETAGHNYLPQDFDSRLKNFFTETL